MHNKAFQLIRLGAFQFATTLSTILLLESHLRICASWPILVPSREFPGQGIPVSHPKLDFRCLKAVVIKSCLIPVPPVHLNQSLNQADCFEQMAKAGLRQLQAIIGSS